MDHVCKTIAHYSLHFLFSPQIEVFFIAFLPFLKLNLKNILFSEDKSMIFQYICHVHLI